MDADIQRVADSLREKSAKRKSSEQIDETKQRLINTVSRRDQAIRMIEEYQDKTGIPTDEEVDNSFLSENNVGIKADDLKEMKSEEM